MLNGHPFCAMLNAILQALHSLRLLQEFLAFGLVSED